MVGDGQRRPAFKEVHVSIEGKSLGTCDSNIMSRQDQRFVGGSHESRPRGLQNTVKDDVHAGQMDFVDNVIDRSTGTIRGRATFANPDGVFTPGMFARVRVPASPPYEALLVPDVAIGSEQVRKFVLVVGADNKAQMKYVTLGQLVDNLRVIKEGLAATDKVIINGMARVRPGQPVNAQPPGAAPSGGAPAPAAK